MEHGEHATDLARLTGDRFEIAYMTRLIGHHATALTMAQAVVGTAPHQEVREAAGRIIDEQRREIDELTVWLRQWYGREVDRDATAMPRPGERPGAGGTPAEAERTFLRQMREHHTSAVEMGELAIARATHPELTNQARAMVASQRQDQERFARWLAEWYGG